MTSNSPRCERFTEAVAVAPTSSCANDTMTSGNVGIFCLLIFASDTAIERPSSSGNQVAISFAKLGSSVNPVPIVLAARASRLHALGHLLAHHPTSCAQPYDLFHIAKSLNKV